MANTTIYPFGTNGTMPSSVGVINDLTTGGADKALSADMGVLLNRKINGIPNVPTLDSVAYEGKTYRQIFESGFYFDAESSFAIAGVEEYMNRPQSTIPVIENSVVDTGTNSLYCEQAVGTSSCLRMTSGNTHKLALNKTYYIACRLNQPTLTMEGANNSIVICESEGALGYVETTSGWINLSALYKNTQSNNASLYFGLFGKNAGTAYIDTLVCVPIDIFVNAPTKAKWDELYNEYVAIKKHLDDSLCMVEFMTELNAKAKKIGMADSTFSNPYGGDKYGYNWTTVEDMMKMMVYATSYPRVLDYMSQNTQVTFQIYGNNARSEVCPLTANSFLDGVASAYTAKHGSGSTMPYQALSHKGAGWGDLNNKDATSKVRGCVGTAIVGTRHVAYCVFQAASAYQSSGTYYRAIVDLLDICKTHFDGGDISGMDVSNYNYAMAVELPTLNPECYKNNFALDTIYLKRMLANGSEVKFNTASAVKVLSTMVMLDALGDDLHQIIEVNSYDESYDSTFWNPNDSGDFEGHAGDKLTLDSALYAMLWYSNGVFTLAGSRIAGAKMICDKMLKGIN